MMQLNQTFKIEMVRAFVHLVSQIQPCSLIGTV